MNKLLKLHIFLLFLVGFYINIFASQLKTQKNKYCEFLYFIKTPKYLQAQDIVLVHMFLQKIAVLESSFFKNNQHTLIQDGIHKGTSALGYYGLMPLTIQELLKRCYKVLPAVEYNFWKKVKPIFIRFDRQLEDKVAKSLAFFILQRMNFNFEKAAFAWIKGHNLINVPKNYQSHWYVQKFKKVSYAHK